MIERDFSHIQQDVLNNSNFEFEKECMKTTSDYFEKNLIQTNGVFNIQKPTRFHLDCPC